MSNKIHISHKLPLIENVQVTKDDFIDAVKCARERAVKDCESKILSWCGAYDVIVHPSGAIQFIATNELKLYNIEGEYLMEAW